MLVFTGPRKVNKFQFPIEIWRGNFDETFSDTSLYREVSTYWNFMACGSSHTWDNLLHSISKLDSPQMKYLKIIFSSVTVPFPYSAKRGCHWSESRRFLEIQIIPNVRYWQLNLVVFSYQLVDNEIIWKAIVITRKSVEHFHRNSRWVTCISVDEFDYWRSYSTRVRI